MDPTVWQPWLVGVSLAAAVMLMVRGRAADIALLGALVVVVVTGVIKPVAAIRGFGNEGLLTVAALFVVAAGMQNTGTIGWLSSLLLRPGKGIRTTLAWMCIPSACLSALLNNTPIVAVLTPATLAFSKRQRISPSKLLMPMCFATTLGGTLTLIGTSTNLVVAGLVESSMHEANRGLRTLGFFDVTMVGAAIAIVGTLYIIFFAPRLLASRVPVIEPERDPRQYTARLAVANGGPLDGRTIAQAGLRRLTGLFLVEIERAGDLIAAPSPDHRLRGGDRLIFAGVVEEIVNLRAMPGLNGDTESNTANDVRRREMVEAVVSNSFPGLGQSIRDFGFRARYDAAVIAVARNGDRVSGRIGDIVLQAGDTLLIEANESFLARNRTSKDFYLVSALPTADMRPRRAPIAIFILIAMIVGAIVSGNMLAPALTAATAMVALGCLRAADARASIDLSILIVIGGGLGLSAAVESSGLGTILGNFIVGLAGMSAASGATTITSLVAVYVATVILTSLISNAAAAAIVFPLALGTAASAHADPMPFVFAVLFAASAAFATPIGYTTNLMIYGPGRYRFSDFVRFGLPLNILLLITTIAMLIWQYGLWNSP